MSSLYASSVKPTDKSHLFPYNINSVAEQIFDPQLRKAPPPITKTAWQHVKSAFSSIFRARQGQDTQSADDDFDFEPSTTWYLNCPDAHPVLGIPLVSGRSHVQENQLQSWDVRQHKVIQWRRPTPPVTPNENQVTSLTPPPTYKPTPPATPNEVRGTLRAILLHPHGFDQKTRWGDSPTPSLPPTPRPPAYHTLYPKTYSDKTCSDNISVSYIDDYLDSSPTSTPPLPRAYAPRNDKGDCWDIETTFL